MIPNEIIQSFYQDAANNLVGRDCVIRWVQPDPPFEKGSCTLGDRGPIITIDPTLPREKQYRVFLHECAHARDFITRSEAQTTGGRKVQLPDNLTAALVRGIAEVKAETTALKWYAWAKSKGDSLILRLIGLAGFAS